MHKSFDNRLNSYINYIYAGECFVGRGNEIISTVLGSCIAICLFDRKAKIGGMIHYLLPDDGRDSGKLDPMNYGNKAIESLISCLIKEGGSQKNLVAKIFGGTSVFCNVGSENIGLKNITFAREILKSKGITVIEEDVGGFVSRKIYFFPGSNRVFLKEVK